MAYRSSVVVLLLACFPAAAAERELVPLPPKPVPTATHARVASAPAAKPAAIPDAPAALPPSAERPAEPPQPVAPLPAPVPQAAAPAAAAPAPVVVKKPIAFAAVSSDPRPTLDPDTFINTLRAAERHHQIAEAGGWGVLPKGASLKLGDAGQLVVRLKERLAASGDLSSDPTGGETFDAALVAAAKRFQARHGLPETGLVGAKTIDALNVPAEIRARQLSASAQRLAGSRFPFGERYVVVNIPAATVEAVEKGQVARRYVAVAGKKDRASPTLMARIASINLNPTWTAPVSVIKKDIIPHMRKDPAYLAKMRIRILDGQGQEVDPRTIDWSTEKAANYTLRQDAGAKNSLGEIRIDMPNRHAVYMHDTPTKALFAQGARFHSSGCVRIGDVRAFAEWLLEGTAAPETNAPWTQGAIAAAIATGKRHDIVLRKPIPVAWVYMTGFATPDGTVHFRDDIYGLDAQRAPPPLSAPGDEVKTSSIKRKPAF